MGYKVLGIECDDSRCHGADLRAGKISSDKLKNFKSLPLWLRDEDISRNNFSQIINKYYSSSDSVSCGDSVEHWTKDTDNKGECLCGENHSELSTFQIDETDPNVTCSCTGACDCVSSQTHKLNAVCDHATNVSDILRTNVHVHHIDGLELNNSDIIGGLNKPPDVVKHQYTELEDDQYDKDQPNPNSITSPFNASVTANKICTDNICLLGLHACGDLTPTMLKLFIQMEELKTLVTVGCCYHRMTCSENNRYNQFPMSNSLNEIQDAYPDWIISTFALRLSAQETRARWKAQSDADHQFHQNNVSFRGILDMMLDSDNLCMHKDKRKLANRRYYTDFESYMEEVLPRITVSNVKDRSSYQSDGDLRDRLMKLYKQHMDVYKLIEPFTCLQVILQGVFESLLLVDRIVFLKEHGLDADLIPVMDDYVSPRNMAIIAWKT